MSNDEILKIASHKPFMVRRALSSHDKLREQCRLLVAQGKLRLMRDTGTEYWYEAVTKKCNQVQNPFD